MKLFAKLSERVSTDFAIIAVLVVVTIAVRLVSFTHLSSLASMNPDAYPYPIVPGDSVHYAQWADNLLTIHAYQEPAGVPLRAAPPGYPALLAFIKILTGSFTWVVVLQTLFTALAATLIYRMARTMLPAAIAAIPAFVYAIDPMTVFIDTVIMTDGLFSALLICIVYLAFFEKRLRSLPRWSLVGLLLGLATIIRPIAEFLVFVFPALYLVREWFTVRTSNPLRGEINYQSSLKAVGVCVVAFALVVVPWMVRNHTYFGSYEISPLGGHNLLTNDLRGFLAWRALANTPDPMPAILVMRHFDDPVFESVDRNMALALARLTPPGGNIENYEGKLALSYIMHDPVRYAYFHGVNSIPFFISSSISSYGQIIRQLRDNEGFYAPGLVSLLGSLERIRHPEDARSFMTAVWSVAPVVLEVLWWVLVVSLALVALILRRRDFTVVLCTVLIVYFAALTGPMATSRYRIPAEPYLLILAAVGLHALVHRIKEKMV